MTDVGVSPPPQRRAPATEQATRVPGIPGVPGFLTQAQAEDVARARQIRDEGLRAIEEARPQIRAAEQRLANVRTPEAPQFDDVPEAPHIQQTDPTRVFGQFLPVVAMLGGAFVRGDATAALRAGAAAMNAARANDTQALEQAHQQWMDHMEALRLKGQQQLERFQAALQLAGEDRAEAQAQLTAAAAEYQIPSLQQALVNGDLSAVSQMTTAYQRAFGQLMTAQRMVQNHQDQMQLQVSREEDRMHNQWVGDPIVKPYLQSQQWFNHFFAMTMPDPHNPTHRILRPEFNNGTSQLQLKDSAQRLFTGQAIREFMMRAMDEGGSLGQRASGLMHSLEQGGAFGPQQMQQLIDNVSAIHEAMTQTYEQRRAGYEADANVMQQRYGRMFDPQRVFRDTEAIQTDSYPQPPSGLPTAPTDGRPHSIHSPSRNETYYTDGVSGRWMSQQEYSDIAGGNDYIDQSIETPDDGGD